MEPIQSVTKKVTLAEVHEWIVRAREIMELADDEGMLGYLDIFVLPDEDTPLLDVLLIATTFRETLHHVEMLDIVFHDKFDCR